jgi:NAD(P)H-hydrate epimerase
MQTVVKAKEMADMDRFTIKEHGIPGMVLMENAGRGTVDIALSMLNGPNKRIFVFCGPGNNGGDGYVIARYLLNAGHKVRIYILTKREKIKGDALSNLTILEHLEPDIEYIEKCPEIDSKPDLVVDAMLGTGVKDALRGVFADMATEINSWHVPVLSVDIPTGVDADTGKVDGPCVKATHTATMALKKRGLILFPGRNFAGQVNVIDIGMLFMVERVKSSRVFITEEQDIINTLPARSPDAHKNKCGTVGVLAGSLGLTGAATLTSEGVLRAGAGLCYLCAPKSINHIYEIKNTEVITWPFDDADTGYLHAIHFEEIFARLDNLDVLAMGPGLGQHGETGRLLTDLLKSLEKPVVMDADGLNLFSENIDPLVNYRGDMVLTPHPGELARLTGISSKDIVLNKIDVARKYAKEWNKVLVIKGGPTVIGTPDGTVYINSTGNAGMATGGSGDVLTGVIAGLIAQGLNVVHAAMAGVYVHGLAGDMAKDKVGLRGMIAGDMLSYIPQAIKALKKDEMI